MNYHNITTDDMLNGEGLRVVLWLSGCNHYCKECQNPQTWDSNSGIPFDESAKEEIFNELKNDYISGITFSGGDPLYERNRAEVSELIDTIKEKFPSKTIWLYTGYTLEEIQNNKKLLDIVIKCDVIVEGMFDVCQMDINYHWAGSANQRVLLVNGGEFNEFE